MSVNPTTYSLHSEPTFTASAGGTEPFEMMPHLGLGGKLQRKTERNYRLNTIRTHSFGGKKCIYSTFLWIKSQHNVTSSKILYLYNHIKDTFSSKCFFEPLLKWGLVSVFPQQGVLQTVLVTSTSAEVLVRCSNKLTPPTPSTSSHVTYPL